MEFVGRVFVLAYMLELHLDAQLVERALQVHELRAQTLHIEKILRGHVDLVRSSRDIILMRGRPTKIGVDRLAGLFERENVGPQFLELCPTRRKPARLDHQSLDARIQGCLLQELPRFGDRHRGLILKEGNRHIHGRLLRKIAFQMEHQR